jgi:hypothetical protein
MRYAGDGWCTLCSNTCPNVPPPAWRETAPRIAALEAPDVSGRAAGSLREAERADRAASCACLRARHAGRGRASRRERGTEGYGSGRHRSADRGSGDRVLAVDFKTNASGSRPARRPCPRVCCARWAPMPRCCARSIPTEKSPPRSLWSRTAQLMALPARSGITGLSRARRDARLLDEVLGSP